MQHLDPLGSGLYCKFKKSYINLAKISIGIDDLFSLLHLSFYDAVAPWGVCRMEQSKNSRCHSVVAICRREARRLMGILSLADTYFSSAFKTKRSAKFFMSG